MIEKRERKEKLMKKTKELSGVRVSRALYLTLFTIALVLSLALFGGYFSIVSHAESAARVISTNGANVRSSASASATQVSSFAQNDTISIRSQVQGSDGYTWYEVWIDAERRGYVRSDLVEITDGTTPPTSTETGTQTPETTQPAANNNLPQAEVSQLNPISATVINGGSSGVRIRSNASTDSQIITTVQNGLLLTVVGQAASLDEDGGKIWYQVNFNTNGTDVSGFIRDDYVELSEEPTAYTEPSVDPEPGIGADDQPETPTQPEVSNKEYDTVLQDGVWKLRIPGGSFYDIQGLLQINEYANTFEDNEKKIKSQKTLIVILVLLLVFAAAAIGYLIYKIKDMMDSAYFSEVENETLRRRSGQNGQNGQNGRLMHNVGVDKKGPPQRPQGARPLGSPQGQKAAGASQNHRPEGAPQGQRSAGTPSQGQRTVGSPQGQRTERAPQGQRAEGTPQGQRAEGPSQGQRPSGSPQGQRTTGAPQGQRPSGAPQSQKPTSPQNAGRPQPKNFMSGDDEFEFEFLNYEGEDEN